MTDVPEGSGPVPRRTPRSGDGGAPVSGALAIALAVIAVVAGFLILNSISGDDERQLGITTGDGSPAGDDGTADTIDTTEGPDGTGVPTIPTTTEPAIVTEGATVMVVNANMKSGTAGQMRTALQSGAGFSTVDPGDGAGLDGALEKSIIYYDAGQVAAIDVANSLNRVLGGDLSVSPLPDPANPPIQGGNPEGAGVILMLGLDKAGKTLEELNPAGAQPPAVITNPPPPSTTTPSG